MNECLLSTRFKTFQEVLVVHNEVTTMLMERGGLVTEKRGRIRLPRNFCSQMIVQNRYYLL